MSFGIEVFNEPGGLQINTDDPLYILYSTGTVTLNAAGAGTVAVPSVVSSPLLFVSSPDYVCLANFSSATLTLYGVPGTAVSYKLYAAASEIGVPAGSFGMAVYGPSGELIYSAEARPLNIAAMASATRSASGFSYSHGISGGYVLLAPFTFSRWEAVQEFPFPASYCFAFGVKTSGATAIAGHTVVGSLPALINAADPYDGTPVPIFVIAP